ncbi:hypothetical protein OM310_25140, partial [Escherichia albertii]|nr:hypothetical protein [Escherichia albertii]
NFVHGFHSLTSANNGWRSFTLRDERDLKRKNRKSGRNDIYSKESTLSNKPPTVNRNKNRVLMNDRLPEG